MAFSEYANYDGLGLAELVRKKKVSPSELVEEAIRRIEAHNSKLNAVVLPLFERAREKAKGKLPEGPFTGVPFMMKDLHATLEGVPTSHGNNGIHRAQQADRPVDQARRSRLGWCRLPRAEMEAVRSVSRLLPAESLVSSQRAGGLPPVRSSVNHGMGLTSST